jgi:hypothetical protein
MFEEPDPIVLEFHHLHGKDKAISQLVTEGASVEKLTEEMENARPCAATAIGRLRRGNEDGFVNIMNLSNRYSTWKRYVSIRRL